ncbi:hypothetical protein GQ607_010402 [Colletotrichum asianum]|uniref:Uncharacterized protein n=1 Tax=Colletotrichum asianum TaxID=702518 RepID=A0A8H3W4M6_9PEZI|nr:hypothetical protein GQ607_010402 [Colletotrichum asianum]
MPRRADRWRMAPEVAQLQHDLTRDVVSCTGKPPQTTTTLTVSQQASPRPGRDARREKQKERYAFIRGIMGTKGGSRNAEEGKRGGAAEIIRSPRRQGKSWFAPKRARNRTDLAAFSSCPQAWLSLTIRCSRHYHISAFSEGLIGLTHREKERAHTTLLWPVVCVTMELSRLLRISHSGLKTPDATRPSLGSPMSRGFERGLVEQDELVIYHG